MKDHDKYEYVEVALPKDNPAVQRMLAYSKDRAKPMRLIVKEAAIDAWIEDNATEVPSVKAAKKPAKKRTVKAQGVTISDASKESANSLLDDMGL